MKKTYKQGIEDLNSLLRGYDTVLTGNTGMSKAYEDFLTINKIERKPPTENQLSTLKGLNIAIAIMQYTAELFKSKEKND
jgi:hypothetical protein